MDVPCNQMGNCVDPSNDGYHSKSGRIDIQILYRIKDLSLKSPY